MNTPLTIDHIASPIFAMPRNSTLRQVLTEMFTRRFRRIFLDGISKDKVITDRRIISYVFGTQRLDDIVSSSSNLLEVKVDELEPMEAIKLPGKTKVKDAASTMMEQIEECLICEKGVITPWDMIMKPWSLRRLTLKA